MLGLATTTPARGEREPSDRSSVEITLRPLCRRHDELTALKSQERRYSAEATAGVDPRMKVGRFAARARVRGHLRRCVAETIRETRAGSLTCSGADDRRLTAEGPTTRLPQTHATDDSSPDR